MRKTLCWITLLTAGCSSGDPAAVAEPGPGTQATCNAAVEPFGVDATAGESLPDLAFADCSGEARDVEALRCGQELTWIEVGAGWCQPCQEEASDLEAAQAAYGDEVRFVQVLFEGTETMAPPTTQFCSNWVDTYDLSIDVLIDAEQHMTDYFERSELPLNMLLDRDGKVLWSAPGKPADIAAIVDGYR